jgi:sugar phosphate isomerase/epimerase
MKDHTTDRRAFITRGSILAAGAAAVGCAGAAPRRPEELFKISLAQWSLNRSFFAKKLDPLDFARITRSFDIEAVEYVNQFYKDKRGDAATAAELKKRAEGEGVKSLLIMCDGEGRLGDPDEKKRAQAVENHVPWLEWAKALGCHSIRVNAASAGSYEEQAKLATDGLRRLSERGAKFGLGVIVENHGGLSSNGKWLSGVIRAVGLPNCGTLPDFGNFGDYDRYLGVTELMPFAKGVSAKSGEFDEAGNETRTDYRRMLKIVLDAGYHGYVGIEFEGGKLAEADGIRKTLDLLLKVRDEFAARKG